MQYTRDRAGNQNSYFVGNQVNRTQVEVILLANFRKLSVEVDFVSFDETLESFQVVVDDAVVETQTPTSATAANASTAAGNA